MYTYTCMYTCIHTRVCRCVCACTYVCKCMYIRTIYLHMYAHSKNKGELLLFKNKVTRHLCQQPPGCGVSMRSARRNAEWHSRMLSGLFRP